MDNGIVWVLAHHVKPASLGADGCHLLSHRHIQVLQETCSTLTMQATGRFVSVCAFVLRFVVLTLHEQFIDCEAQRERCDSKILLADSRRQIW